MNNNNNIYLRDLMARQNQGITEAQLHLYLNAKRYSMKEIEECVKEMNEIKGSKGNKGSKDNRNQLDLNGEVVGTKSEQLEGNSYEVTANNLFLYHGRIIMLDSERNHLILKYKEGLFSDIILELKKLYSWLDDRAAYLKFIGDDEKEYVIDKTEIASVIHFFDKLDKIKED